MENTKMFSRENVNQKYLDLRVDFLDGDELKEELSMRQIIVTGDRSMSRLRRMLRDAIKQEKEHGFNDRILLRSPLQELEICESKLDKFEMSAKTSKNVAPKNHSLLLHLANRLMLMLE